jgi:hypothetical protein
VITLSRELRIHAWGGLGSQLFAVALLKDIEKNYSARRITIFLHTGGVTRRIPEVVELFPEISFSYLDDFSKSSVGAEPGMNSARTWYTSCLKGLLTLLGLMQTCDNDNSFKRVRFWTQSIRGHYSYRTISSEFLLTLSERLQLASQRIEGKVDVCSVHYRLGDLLNLENKHPILPITILDELERICKGSDFSAIEIYSDSPSRAQELLDPHGGQNVFAPDLDTVSVLARATQTEYFIGTSSKVSFWIAAIRSAVFKKQSSIPVRNKREITGLLNQDFRHVHLYGA